MRYATPIIVHGVDNRCGCVRENGIASPGLAIAGVAAVCLLSLAVINASADKREQEFRTRLKQRKAQRAEDDKSWAKLKAAERRSLEKLREGPPIRGKRKRK